MNIENWYKSRQKIAGNSAEIRTLNNHLLKFTTAIYDKYNQLEAGNEDFDVYNIKKKITGVKLKDFIIETYESRITSIERK